MKSKTHGLVLIIRRWLQLDSWGKDLYRIKHRIGVLWQENGDILEMYLDLSEEVKRLDRLTEEQQAHINDLAERLAKFENLTQAVERVYARTIESIKTSTPEPESKEFECVNGRITIIPDSNGHSEPEEVLAAIE